MTNPRPSKINLDALARFVQANYEQLLDDNDLQSPFPDDALRAISLAMIDIDRHLGSIDSAMKFGNR